MNLIPFAETLLRVHWKLIAAAIMLALLGVQTLRVASLKSSLSAEKAGRLADRETYKRAQMEATANAFAAKIKKEAEDAKKADAADARYADLSGQYRAAVLRYQAAQRTAGKADLPQSPEGPASSDGSGGFAVVPTGSLLIPQADALICAENTARLEAVREWALSLDPN
jgi:hypothetical protein